MSWRFRHTANGDDCGNKDCQSEKTSGGRRQCFVGVRCCGAYPDGQAYADLLASYDLTLLPTVFPEGAPLVLLESMACGVPFVANGMGGIPDYATDNPDCVVVAQQGEFLDGVRRMVQALSREEIDQSRLQGYYRAQYSQAAIEKQWLSYLAS